MLFSLVLMFWHICAAFRDLLILVFSSGVGQMQSSSCFMFSAGDRFPFFKKMQTDYVFLGWLVQMKDKKQPRSHCS